MSRYVVEELANSYFDTYLLLADKTSDLFNSHFLGKPEYATTRMSPFWILFERRMMEAVMTTGAISRAKLQPNHHHQQTIVRLFLQGMCPSYCPTSSIGALKEEVTHSMDLLIPSSHGVF